MRNLERTVLWTPEKERLEREHFESIHQSLMALFRAHPEWQVEAAAIHHAHLGTGEPCDRCKEYAAIRHCPVVDPHVCDN